MIRTIKLIAATKNNEKLKEFRRMINIEGIEVAGLENYPDIVPPPEPDSNTTYYHNAKLKALTVFEKMKGWCFGDDSGIEVEFLDGLPGINSARFASPDGDSQKNIEKLLKMMEGVQWHERKATMKCTIVLLIPAVEGGYEEAVFKESFRGYITFKPSGKMGFGYDPIFYIPQLGKTSAELLPEQKDRISHRGKAVQKMVKYIKKRINKLTVK